MIIGIDATPLTKHHKTGVEKAASSIVKNMLVLDKKDQFYLYTPHKLSKIYTQNKNVREIFIPLKRFWHKIRLPLSLALKKPHVFIELSNTLPAFSPSNNLVLVYDFGFKYFPETYSKKDLALQESAIKNTATKAKNIAFSSRNSRDDFKKFYPEFKGKSYIVPISYDQDIFFPIEKPKNVLDIKSPYFLYVGRIEHKKNIQNLIKAYKIFRQNQNKDVKLVLCGSHGHGFSDIDLEIHKLAKFKNDVILPGYVHEKDLPHLYNKALAFVFPSNYEGFGIPILEAFSCGTPVICSNSSSLPEVADEAVLYVEPDNPFSIAEAMKKIMDDNKLRQALIKKGLKQVKKFSYKNTALKILKIIEAR